MARTKGSKNRPKDETVIVGLGHNQPPPEAEMSSEAEFDEQRQKLYIQYLEQEEDATDEKDVAASKIKNIRKAAKADGFSRAEINFGLRLRKANETDELDRWRRETQIARWLNHPIGAQAGLFDDVDRTPSVDKTKADGKIAGMSGRSCHAPQHLAQAQAQAWISGWHEGQAVNAKGIRPLSDARETADHSIEEAQELINAEI